VAVCGSAVPNNASKGVEHWRAPRPWRATALPIPWSLRVATALPSASVTTCVTISGRCCVFRTAGCCDTLYIV